MTDGPGGKRWTLVRLAGVLASIIGIVAAVLTVWQWTESHWTKEPPGRPDAVASMAPSASATVGGDDRFLQVGQCVRNLGDDKIARLKIVDCGPGMQRVVAKVEQMFNQDSEEAADAQADAACEKLAPGYTDYYFSDWTPDSSRSVVFCVRAV